MLHWPPGSFSLNEDILSHEKTVTLAWEQILLEGARRADAGISEKAPSTTPIVTPPPATSSRVRHSLPKITVLFADERPRVYELEAEYTHVGRASGNEVPLSDPSVSNRHCIFILNGPDVILRDLNSSNGTLVNGERITEVVLRPGDDIYVGSVQMKFEPAVRRPKLTGSLPRFSEEQITSILSRPAGTLGTIKLPTGRPANAGQRRENVSGEEPVQNDSAFVKGKSAISYENIPKPEEQAGKSPLVLILAVIVVIVALGGGAWFYFHLFH